MHMVFGPQASVVHREVTHIGFLHQVVPSAKEQCLPRLSITQKPCIMSLALGSCDFKIVKTLAHLSSLPGCVFQNVLIIISIICSSPCIRRPNSGFFSFLVTPGQGLVQETRGKRLVEGSVILPTRMDSWPLSLPVTCGSQLGALGVSGDEHVDGVNTPFFR